MRRLLEFSNVWHIYKTHRLLGSLVFGLPTFLQPGIMLFFVFFFSSSFFYSIFFFLHSLSKFLVCFSVSLSHSLYFFHSVYLSIRSLPPPPSPSSSLFPDVRRSSDRKRRVAMVPPPPWRPWRLPRVRGVALTITARDRSG